MLSITESRQGSRRGAVLVLVAASLPVLLAVTALAVDLGYLVMVRTQLQAAADAAAFAGAQGLPDHAVSRSLAQQYADLNHPTDGTVLKASDIAFGRWNGYAREFERGHPNENAIQVTVRRCQENGNPLRLFFAAVRGRHYTDVEATATVMVLPIGGTRFLIDDEMIDTDLPAIQDLAARMGTTPDEFLQDADGDWFIDLPPGEFLELPTGQMGDEGIFRMLPEFPFTGSSSPSFTDFLNYNEDSSSWRYDLIPKEMLDPLVGVAKIDDGSRYSSYVDPGGFVHVSPVFKSDISVLDPVNGVPAVNALGERRGLLAFTIEGVGEDPDGDGSLLPNLIIGIVDPSTVSLGDETPGGDEKRRYRLVD